MNLVGSFSDALRATMERGNRPVDRKAKRAYFCVPSVALTLDTLLEVNESSCNHWR